jgi:hypothetical protein
MEREQPRVFADFQNCDPSGCIRLSCTGTLHDLSEQGIRLHEGLVLRLYDDGLEADGTVHYSTDENRWVAAVDWDAIEELD